MWGDVLSIVGNTQYRGDIRILVGDIMSTMEVFNTMGGYDLLQSEYRGGCHEYLGGTQITKDCIPHGTEHPHSTHDIPHMYHDVPHCTEYCPRYSRYPPTVLSTPWY